MALDFLEGFDYYSSVGTDGVGVGTSWVGNGELTLVAGRFLPGLALRFRDGGLNNALRTRAITPCTKFTFGFAQRTDITNASSQGSSRWLIQSVNGNTQFVIGFDNLGRIKVAGNENLNTPLAISSKPILQLTWHFIEIEFVLSASVGRFTLYLDGERVINLENISTRAGVDNDIGRMAVKCGGFNGSTETSIDDVYCYVDEAQARGEARVLILKPTSNDTVAWTPSAGLNWQCVSEVPVDGDASYNSTNQPGDVDLFFAEQITINPNQIFAVEVIMAARKEDAGTRTIRAKLKSNGVVGNGANQNLITDYRWIRQIYAKNPDGNLVWNKSAINAMRFGYELVL